MISAATAYAEIKAANSDWHFVTVDRAVGVGNFDNIVTSVIADNRIIGLDINDEYDALEETTEADSILADLEGKDSGRLYLVYSDTDTGGDENDNKALSVAGRLASVNFNIANSLPHHEVQAASGNHARFRLDTRAT